MGGKNQTQTTNSSQTYTPAGASQLQDIWNRVQQVASTPYTPYGGELVAGLTPTQQSGINNTNAAVGTAQPYINTAANYATQGASAISPDQIARYTNPYTQSVINATQANFNEGNAQQQQQVKGNAALQGALGGDRVGVAQAELARQQQLAQAPVIAGLQNQNFQQALQAAQQDRAAQAQGAYTFGNLGTTAQNAALQGAQAQLGAGAVQQGTEQNKLSANYNQYLQALAFPYQQAQFLASTGLPTIQAMGGTQSGNSTTTAPGPSPWGQIAGLGLTAAGLFSNPFSSSGSGTFNAVGGGQLASATQPWGATTAPGGFTYNYAQGGAVHGDDTDTFVKSVASIRKALSRGGIVLDTERGRDGVFRLQGYAAGGDVSPFDRINQGFGDADAALALGDFDMQGAANGVPALGYSGTVPLPMARPAEADMMMAGPARLPPQITNPDGNAGAGLPDSALGYAASSPYAAGYAGAGAGAPQGGATVAGPSGGGGLFNLSDEARQGLITAGLGMMASRSPFALSAIGEGGLAGMERYAQARKTASEKALAEGRLDLQGRELAQKAEQFAKSFGLQQQQYKEGVRQHDIANMQPVQIGQTPIGQPVYGIRDPKSGTIKVIDPATGQPREPGAPAPASMVPATTELTGEEYLKTIDPQVASVVKAIDEGRMQAPSGMMLRTPYGQTIQRALGQYNPNFDWVNPNARMAARKDFTSGKSAQNITSFNTAIGHLDSLDKVVDKLDNSGYPLWNRIANASRENTDPKFAATLKEFNTAKTAVTDELTRAFRGSGGNVHDIVEWEKNINSADSPQALHAAIKQAIELLNSRIESVGDQYNRGMGTTKDPLTLLSPKAQSAVKRMQGQGEAPASVSVPPPAERETGKVYDTPKGKARWLGNGWQLVQ